MPLTTMTGPLKTGTNKDNPGNSTAANQINMGTVLLQQSVTVGNNGSTAVDGILYLPKSSRIHDILVDVTTVFNSATSNTLSVGVSSGDTTYASGVDVKTSAIRIRPTFTAAQLAALLTIGTTNVAVYATQTPVGSASAGSATVTVIYSQA